MGSRVLIAGAGALGSVFGGLLAAAGHEVTLLGRAPHLARVAAAGLVIEGLFGAHRVRNLHVAFDTSELRAPFDAILVTVKSFDTEAMLAATAGLLVPARVLAPAGVLAPTGALISLQNGLGNVERVRRRRRARARARRPRDLRSGDSAAGDGARHRERRSRSPSARRSRAHRRRKRRRARGRRTSPTPAFRPSTPPTLHAHLWAKVFYNAALNPLGALFGVPYGALAADADTRAIMDAAIDECFAVAAARGVAMTPATADAYRALFYERLVPPTAQHRSSMLQDIERSRSTEIEAINGCIWTYGRAAGIPTPVNMSLTCLIRARERLVRVAPVPARGGRRC